ncbi:hypothetical protein HaLaN_26576 [Haematococcus lacustris]|uniref:Uncharacterized protein n=1 Tax=Haematococcus lacustris TaxID=44745 RepID=A0A6A0A6H9_HAELA|nr:hypothetical protein HaLaN_26576 [Haematococcus lacustris]
MQVACNPAWRSTASRQGHYSSLIWRHPLRQQRCRAIEVNEPSSAPPASPTIPAQAPGPDPASSPTVTPDSLQAKAQAFLAAIMQHRRAITLAVALLDVAFIWLVVKGVRVAWFHEE